MAVALPNLIHRQGGGFHGVGQGGAAGAEAYRVGARRTREEAVIASAVTSGNGKSDVASTCCACIACRGHGAGDLLTLVGVLDLGLHHPVGQVDGITACVLYRPGQAGEGPVLAPIRCIVDGGAQRPLELVASSENFAIRICGQVVCVREILARGCPARLNRCFIRSQLRHLERKGHRDGAVQVVLGDGTSVLRLPGFAVAGAGLEGVGEIGIAAVEFDGLLARFLRPCAGDGAHGGGVGVVRRALRHRVGPGQTVGCEPLQLAAASSALDSERPLVGVRRVQFPRYRVICA